MTAPDRPGTPETAGQAPVAADLLEFLAGHWDSEAKRLDKLMPNTEHPRALALRDCAAGVRVLVTQAAIAAAAPAADDAAELAMLRADLADYEALLAKWPKCPAGCNCRIGLPDDADANECGCDGPCNGGAAPAPAGDGDVTSAQATYGRYRQAMYERGVIVCDWDGLTSEDRESWADALVDALDAASGAAPAPAAPARAGSTAEERRLRDALLRLLAAAGREPDDSEFAGLVEDIARDALGSGDPQEPQPQAAPDLARAETAAIRAAAANTARELAELRERITALAEQVTASAQATEPSRKSQIEHELAIELRKLLEDQ